MIDVKDLTKSFGKHQVLQGINEHIEKGEKVAIIGPSGSGKSTFLRCLNLLEEPTSGTITFEGVDITDPKNDINKLRARMGMVFQQFNLFPHMTVKQNITLAPVKLKLMTKEEADQKPWSFWSGWACRTRSTPTPSSSPAGSSSASPSPGPWP